MQQYRYRDGFRTLSALKPAVVADELERIKEANGVLTSDGVLEAARPEGALLHNEFEWDGEAAVRKLGMLRASAIIRAVVIIPDEPKTHPHRIETEADPDDPREAMKAVIGLAWAHDCNPGGEVRARRLPIDPMTNRLRARLARVPRRVLLDRATLEHLDLI